MSSTITPSVVFDEGGKKPSLWYAHAALATCAAPITLSVHAEVLNSGPQDIDFAQGASGFIDLDFDSPVTGYEYGSAEIFVRNYIFAQGNYASLTKAAGDDGTWVGYLDDRNFGYATALEAGAMIGPGSVGPSVFANLGYQGSATPGQFNDYPAVEKFVGLAFTSDAFGGSTHYAWIRLLASVPGGQLTLLDWAFESLPDTAILAGDTGSGTLIVDAIPGGLQADFNNDGFVNLLDLDILGSNWQMPGDATTGDANGDGTVDLLDLDLLGGEWAPGGPASFDSALAASGIAVPEPGSLGLLAAGAAGLLRFRSRRVR